MARCRNLKPGFFKNEFLAMLPFEARMLFAGLWTLADREGRLEDRPGRIKAELFPFDSVDVDDLLAKLATIQHEDQDRPFIYRYVAAGKKVIQIVAFAEHQKPHANETSYDLPAYDDSLSSQASPSDTQESDQNPSTREISRALGKKSEHSGNGRCSSGLLPLTSSLVSSSLVTSSLCGRTTDEPPNDHTGDEAGVPPPEPELQFLEKGGKPWNLPRDKLDVYRRTFGDRFDVDAELAKAGLWLVDNPTRRPLARGMAKFLTSWLNRADEKARKSFSGSGTRDGPRKYSALDKWKDPNFRF